MKEKDIYCVLMKIDEETSENHSLGLNLRFSSPYEFKHKQSMNYEARIFSISFSLILSYKINLMCLTINMKS